MSGNCFCKNFTSFTDTLVHCVDSEFRIAVLDDLIKIVIRVNVHDRKRKAGRQPCLHSETQNDSRVLSFREEKYRALRIGHRISDDM